MSRLSFYLILILLLLILITYFFAENFSKTTPKDFKFSFYAKVLISGFFCLIGFYFLIDYMKAKPESGEKKFYTRKISMKEYEIQKRRFTQMKLAELYEKPEYQEHVKSKLQKSDRKFQDLSDDDF